jgi:hypothetical protein
MIVSPAAAGQSPIPRRCGKVPPGATSVALKCMNLTGQGSGEDQISYTTMAPSMREGFDLMLPKNLDRLPE